MSALAWQCALGTFILVMANLAIVATQESSLQDTGSTNYSNSHVALLHEVTVTTSEAMRDVCNKPISRCQNRCGKKTIDIYANEFCYCDMACLAYGDCCWDFHESCPSLVEMFTQSPQRYTTGRCKDKNNFLEVKTENRTISQAGVSLSGLSLDEVLDFLKPDNVPVTDLRTGFHYRKPVEFEILYPDLSEEEKMNRVVWWKPRLFFLTTPSVDTVLDIMLNKSTVATDELGLNFDPDDKLMSETVYPERLCLLQSVMKCPQVENFVEMRIPNTTFTCQVLQRSNLLAGITISLEPTTPAAEEEIQTSQLQGQSSFQPEPTTTAAATTTAETTIGFTATPSVLDDDSLVSTTVTFPYIVLDTTPLPLICELNFYYPKDFYKNNRNPLLSALFNLRSTGEVLLSSPNVFSSWKTISCSLVGNDKIEAEDKNFQTTPCYPKVVCSLNFIFFNGKCIKPILILVRISTPLNVSHSGFHNALTYFFNISNFLRLPKLVLYKDPTSCHTRHANENDFFSYFGQYFIIRHQMETDNRFENQPIFTSMQQALNQMRGMNFISLNVQLCFFFDYKRALLKYGINMEQLINKYDKYDKGMLHESNNQSYIETCQSIPWAWQDDFYLRNPKLSCATIKATSSFNKNSSIMGVEKNTGTNSLVKQTHSALFYLGWLTLLIFSVVHASRSNI